MSYQIGDVATLSLTVTPHAVDTVAAVHVIAPDGTGSDPAPSGDGNGAYTATVLVDQAGLWTWAWTVTGTGAGAETGALQVGPVPPVPVDPAPYATSTDLANWLQTAPPVDADRLLARASALLDDTVTAQFDVDDVTQLPTDPVIARALKDACCAVVEHWAQVGEDTDVAARPASYSIGKLSVTWGQNTGKSAADVAPRALRALQTAGLLSTAGAAW